MSHNCYTSEQATKKNRGEWQDFFCFSEIFLKSPPTMRRLHFKTPPTEIKTISRIPRHRPQATEFQKSCQSTGANKGDKFPKSGVPGGIRTPNLLIRSFAIDLFSCVV
jgi:hypothetical protein